MTRLTLLYKMSPGQIEIDVNTYPNPYTERRTRERDLYRYRQEKAKKMLFLFLFSKDPKNMEQSTGGHSRVKLSSYFPI